MTVADTTLDRISKECDGAPFRLTCDLPIEVGCPTGKVTLTLPKRAGPRARLRIISKDEATPPDIFLIDEEGEPVGIDGDGIYGIVADRTFTILWVPPESTAV
jgi:hypothetical protein